MNRMGVRGKPQGHGTSIPRFVQSSEASTYSPYSNTTFPPQRYLAVRLSVGLLKWLRRLHHHHLHTQMQRKELRQARCDDRQKKLGAVVLGES